MIMNIPSKGLALQLWDGVAWKSENFAVKLFCQGKCAFWYRQVDVLYPIWSVAGHRDESEMQV